MGFSTGGRGVFAAAFGIAVPVTEPVTDGTGLGTAPDVEAAAAIATVSRVVFVDGARTVSNAWITPLVASMFRDCIIAPFTLSPFESANRSSSPVDAIRVGVEPRLAAITLTGRM